MKWPKRILLVLAAVLLLAGVAMAWLLGTSSGLHVVLARVEHASGGALTVQQAEGRLAGPLQLSGVRYRKRGGGPVVQVGRIELDLHAWALLRGRVHVRQLRVHDVDVALPTKTTPAANRATPSFDPRAPVDVVIDGARIDGVRVHRDANDVFVAERVDLAGAWTGDGIELRPLRVRAPDGRIDLDGRLAFVPGHPGNATMKFDWKAGGRRWAGDMKAAGNGRDASATLALTRPAAARADIRVSTRAPFAWQARVTVPNGPAAPWIGKSAMHQLAATLQAHGDAHQAHARGTLDLDATRVQLAALDARLDASQVRLDRLQLRSPQHPGTLDASGRIDLSTASPTGQLHLAWNDVKIPDTLAGRALATRGTLDVRGSRADYQAVLDGEAGPPGQPSKLLAKVHGTPVQLNIESFAVQQPTGRLDANGLLTFGAGTGWQLSALAKDFDPGRLLAGWNGSLNAQLSGSGQFSDAGTRAQLKLDSLSGTLRGHRVKGQGALALSPRKVLSGTLDLRVGSDHLALAGADGARNDLDVQLRIGALDDWLPSARGAVQSRLRVRGTWPDLSLQGHVDATRPVWKGYRAAQLSARFDITDINQPGGTLDARAEDLHAAGFAFAKVHVDGHGNAGRHDLDIDARGDPLSLRLALQGGLHDKAWNGRLQRMDLALDGQPGWHLLAPAALSWNRGQASLQQACLSAGTPQLCATAERTRDGALHASYRMRELPLELLLALAGNDLPMRAEGTLDGQGDIRRSAGGDLSGQARLLSQQGKVFYPDQPQQPLLRYRAFDAQLDLAPGESQLRIGAQLQDTGRLDGRLRISGPRQELAGNLRMQLDNLHFVELFTHDVANLHGRLDADLTVAGTLRRPALRGQATATELAGEIPALGLKLDQGRMRLSGDDARSLQVDGQVRSGGGTLQVAGTLGFGDGNATDIRLRGQNVQVADIPSAMVRLSPDMRLRREAGVLNIGGTLRVDKADVDLEKLPGGGSTQASPDVVVVDAGEPATQKAAAMPVSTDLQVDLGDHAHVTGYGLDGDLHGKLRVTGRSGQGALGQGQIRIDGTFRAYGQDLRIEQGWLLFASTPLDNPGLDIRAVRKLNTVATVDEGQQVGLQIRGTARQPELTVFSKPVMDPSDALSYLITGKPLSQVKSGEGSMVDSAAQALGSATGDLLARNVGARLGISDIGVSSNDVLGTSAFTVGKYLSPRLYLSYGVGLFEPGQVVTLRFILSRRWNFEAQQATNSSRASLNYRYEH